MDERENNIYDAFNNMRLFNLENAADYADVSEAATQFAVIDESIEAMKDYAATKTSGRKSQAVQQKSVLCAAIRRKMTGISRTARALNFEDEGFRQLFSVPNGNSQPKLIAAARMFADEAAAHQAAFQKLGMKTSLINDLNKDIADYEQAATAKHSAQDATVGATAGIDDAVEKGLQATEIINSIMHNVYDDEPLKLAEWDRARHVKRSARRSKPPGEDNK